jgi:5-hydroxyisourate hydrolase-like protein (transthyretin family)
MPWQPFVLCVLVWPGQLSREANASETVAVIRSADDVPGESAQSSIARTIAVNGVCLDEAQRPLADVQVVLFRMELEPVMRSSRIEETRSDSKGRYRFANVLVHTSSDEARTKYVTVLTAHGHASALAYLASLERDQQQKVTLSAASPVKGRIVDSEGNPVVGATVWARGFHPEMLDGVMSAKTDIDGQFEIADVAKFGKGSTVDFRSGKIYTFVKVLQLRVRHPEWAEQVSSFQNPSDKYSIALARGGKLQGRVIDAVTGMPAANVAVTLRSSAQHIDDYCRNTETDDQGHYRITGLAPADYCIWGSAPDRTCIALQAVSVTANGINEAPDLQLISGGWIEGRVAKLDGQPVSHDPQTGNRLCVGIQGPARPAKGRGIEQCAVDDDGSFRIRLPPGKNFPAILSDGGHVWNQTWRKEELEKGVEVKNGEITKVSFRILEKPEQPRSESPQGNQ